MLMSLPITAGAALLTMVRARTAPPARPVGLAAVTALTTAVTVNRASRRFVSAAAAYRLGLATAVAVRLRTGKEQR
jgi:hypothetical protein